MYSFVICNEGYEIERCIHGRGAEYNEIQPWSYKDIPVTYGAGDQYKGYVVKRRDELQKLFGDREFLSAPYLRVSWFLARLDHSRRIY